MPTYMTSDELKDILSGKPQDVQDSDILDDLVGRGYEIEGYNSEFSGAETMFNIIPSGSKYAKEITHAFRHPLDTLKGLGKAAKSLGEYMIPFREVSDGARAVTDELADMFGERYGTIDRFKNTIEKDPIGFVSDVSAFFTGVGGAAKGVSLGLKGSQAGSRAAKISKLMNKVGSAGIKTGNVLEPTFIVTDVMNPITKKAVRAGASQFMKTGTGEMIENFASASFNRAIKATGGNATNLSKRVYKEPVSTTAAKFGIHGKPVEMRNQSKKLADLSKETVDTKLGEITKTVKNNELVTGALDELDELFARGKFRSPQMKELQQGLIDIRTKHTTEGLNLSEINDLKRTFDTFDNPYRNTASIAGIGKVSFAGDSVKAKDLEFIIDNLRDTIDDHAKISGFKDFRKLNDRTRWNVQFTDMMDDMRYTFADRIDLTDSLVLMGGIMGSVLSLEPRVLAVAAGVTGLRSLVKSPKFASAFANNIMNLQGKQFDDVVKALQTGQHTGSSKLAFKSIFKKLRPVFPEIRIASRITEGVETAQQQFQQPQQPQFQTVLDEGVSQ